MKDKLNGTNKSKNNCVAEMNGVYRSLMKLNKALVEIYTLLKVIGHLFELKATLFGVLLTVQ